MRFSINYNKLYLSGYNIPDLKHIHGANRLKGGDYSFPLDYFVINELIENIGKITADEKVKIWYKKEYRKHKKAKFIQDENFDTYDQGNKELKKYQHQGIDFFYNTKNCILGFNPGLGKTLCAINCIKKINCKKVLIVCPSYLKYNWGDEIEKWSKLNYTVINGTPREREAGFNDFIINNKTCLIINYEQIRFKITKDEMTGKHMKKETKIHDVILNTNWDLLIMDEMHRVKGRNSQCSNGMLKIKAKTKLGLTGTVISKCESEIFMLLKILSPRRYTSYWTFVNYYFNVVDGFYAKEITGIKNKKEYNKLLNRYVLRKKKEDVIDLPEKIIKIIKIQLEGMQLKDYNKAKKNFLKPDDDVIESEVERFIRLNQIVQNPHILGGKNISCIFDACIELLNDIGDEKIIIGCTYIKMSKISYKTLCDKFKDRDIFLINGSVNINKRQNIINKFKKSKNGIIITTIRAMAEGHNIDECDYMIYMDYDWNSATNFQFSERIHRMTTKRSKFYYHLVVKNTVHEYKYKKLIDEEQRMSEALSDTKSNIKTIMEEFKKKGG